MAKAGKTGSGFCLELEKVSTMFHSSFTPPPPGGHLQHRFAHILQCQKKWSLPLKSIPENILIGQGGRGGVVDIANGVAKFCAKCCRGSRTSLENISAEWSEGGRGFIELCTALQKFCLTAQSCHLGNLASQSKEKIPGCH